MTNEPGMQPFDFEFYSEVDDPDDTLRLEAKSRMRKLAQDHDDMIGASVTLDEPSEADESPHVYRAKVVAYTRPHYVAAEEKSGHEMEALKGALDAVERQVREKREKLRTRWRHP